jgi:small conductance mechanosensitive channel
VHDLDSVTGQIEHVLRPDSLLGALAYLVLFCIIASVLSRALGVAIRSAIGHASVDHIDRTAANFLRQLGVLLIWVFVLILYAHLIPALRALGTAMLAGASVASIVLGLAAQTALGNLIAGISLLIYRPFRIGDRLQINAPSGPEIGTVETLSLGYTILSTPDGRRVIVPNSLAISQIAVNLNALSHDAMVSVNFWVTRADLVRARDIALSLARSLGAQVIGCFVIRSEPTNEQLSLVTHPPVGTAAEPFATQLPQRLAEALHSASISTPPGKDAPALAS